MPRFTPADRFLMRCDPVLGRVIRKVRLPESKRSHNHFRMLVEAILSQQLSDKAATTIIRRVRALTPERVFPRPEDVLKMPTPKLRSAGVSGAKARYLKDLAKRVIEKRLHLKRLSAMTNEGVIAELVAVKGIGTWTAEMFLMFGLARPDVFSPGDLGLQNAIARLYGIRTRDAKRLRKFAERWAPQRTRACRYLWKSLTPTKKHPA